MALIRDGAQHFGITLEELRRGPMARVAERFGVVVPALGEVATGAAPAYAYVNHARLVADCPDCNGAEFVYRDGPHVLMCLSCLNGGIGGRWRPVVVPDDLAQIEAILDARPLPQNRNWSPGESLDALRAENVERGL